MGKCTRQDHTTATIRSFETPQVFNMDINTPVFTFERLVIVYLDSITASTMNTSLEKIAHHQRILITGLRASEILDYCKKVLDYHGKSYDLWNEEDDLSDGPIVLITASDDFMAYEPHIVLIDDVPDNQLETYQELANGIPKSGTIVYNMSDKTVKEIGSKERTDVHQVPFDGELGSAVRGLLQRIGIAGERFNQAI